MAVTLLGRTMNIEVLKQPRGFMRCLQFFFAMLAFSFCAGFSSRLSFKIICHPASNETATVEVLQEYSYPFALDHYNSVTVTQCGEMPDKTISFPGDFSSDAKFFVTIGVLCWLWTIFSLIVYTFMSDVYDEEQKKYPIYDLVLAVAFAFFWLASSSAWGHGLSGLKDSGDPSTWIYAHGDNALAKICSKNAQGHYVNTVIESCETDFAGNFAGGNISVVLGFLNVFLWCSNIWFIYKETRFFGSNTGNLQNVESPAGSI